MSFTTLPTVESFGNNDITSLAVGMTTLDTVLSAVSIANFPTDGQFRLLVDSELMLVTGYDSLANQWQVTRGIEGTTITTHAMSAQVVCILTRGSLLKMKADIETTGGSTFIYRDSEPNPGGNIYATFDGAYAAAHALGVPSTIIIDDSLAQCSTGNAAGFAAQVTAVVGTTATITNLLNMTPSVVGTKLALSGAGQAGNNGLFPITAYLSPSSVQITNAAAVAGDSNISWFLITDVHASVPTTTALTMIGGMSGLTPAIVGQSLWFNFAGHAGNNGQFTVVAYVSPTAAWINNPAAVPNDSLSWGTVGGATASITAFDSVANTITLSGLTGMTPNMVGRTFFVSGAATPANNGQFSINAFLSATSVKVNTSGGNVAPDANNGAIHWNVVTAFGATLGAVNYSVATVTGLTGITPAMVGNALMVQNAQTSTNVSLTGSAASITAFANNRDVTITGLTGITPSLVGQIIRVSNTTSSGNDGDFFITSTSGTSQLTYSNAGAVAPDANNGSISWRIRATFSNDVAAAIVGYLSPTSILWNNVNTQVPDANNGSLWWFVGTNYDLSEITLAGTGSFENFFIYDGATLNQGLRGADQQLTVLMEYSFQSYGGTLGISGKFFAALLIDNGAEVTSDGNGQVFDLSVASAASYSVTLDHQGNANALAYLGYNFSAGLQVAIYGAGYVNSDLVQGANGSLSIIVESPTNIPPSTTYNRFYGTPGLGVTVEYVAAASTLAPFTGSGTFPTPNVSGIFAAGPYNVATGTMYFDQTTGRPFWWNGTAWMTVGGGVEVLTATPGSTPSTPTATLSLAVEASVLVNTTGAIAYFKLPNGTDGLVKEIVNGVNTTIGQLTVITMQNNVGSGNDPIDIPVGGSARLTWSTAHGGWIALSTCTNVNNFWD